MIDLEEKTKGEGKKLKSTKVGTRADVVKNKKRNIEATMG
jgi:hypothetical protein